MCPDNLTDSSRGKIRNTTHASQLNDFSGLRFDKITPTDIDGFIDFGDRVFVLFELKYSGAAVPRGQKLAIERMVDRWFDSGIYAIGIIADHQEQGDMVNAAAAIVREVRFEKRWRQINSKRTLKQFIDDAIDMFL